MAEKTRPYDSLFEKRLKNDVVLNVDMIREECKFDLLKLDSDGNLTYSSKSYHLFDCNNGYIGLFELFDDIFQKRIRFFNSSRNVQKFLLSIDKSEKAFSEKTGRSFLDFYSEVRNKTADIANMKSSFSNPMTESISSGYGIEAESRTSRNFSKLLMSMMDSGSIVSEIIENYDKSTDSKTGNYICVDMTDSDNPTLFMDSVLNMPLLIYYFDYAIKYIENLVIPYSISGIFGKNKFVEVRIYNLRNDRTLNETLGICKEDGTILDFSKDIFEDDFIKIKFDREYCEGKFLSSIIGH